jgi:hypothetical protein
MWDRTPFLLSTCAVRQIYTLARGPLIRILFFSIAFVLNSLQGEQQQQKDTNRDQRKKKAESELKWAEHKLQ